MEISKTYLHAFFDGNVSFSAHDIILCFFNELKELIIIYKVETQFCIKVKLFLDL